MYENLPEEALGIISDVLRTKKSEIANIGVLKQGMTNRSFIFTCQNQKYIIRIPGEGTGFLINRQQEFDVYETIKDKGLCDNPIYINPQNGYKITEFLPQVKTCNASNLQNVKLCMEKLHALHNMKLQVNHTFDIFKQIDFYESLWTGTPSHYPDYQQVKENVFSLQTYIDKQSKQYCLTHIDAVPDNFLFSGDNIQLTDWEYAGMQDPHVDIAMFAIYSFYTQKEADVLIDLYFEGECDRATRLKIYCYMAAGGLLWSNWCEYKRKLGIKFGTYARRQYEYAKEYYEIVHNELQCRR
ncbi:phosphotransferase family protein [Anaerovibrio lipolyticus]|nr:phosphotransferase family protein [Anaerovibrio lipolyticus]